VLTEDEFKAVELSLEVLENISNGIYVKLSKEGL
jgi:hypothetical protein